jgi:hypothetical protein
MVFDARRQAKESGMQVLWQFYFTTRIECSSIWAIDVMAMGKLELKCVQGHIHE